LFEKRQTLTIALQSAAAIKPILRAQPREIAVQSNSRIEPAVITSFDSQIGDRRTHCLRAVTRVRARKWGLISFTKAVNIHRLSMPV
jgi:hypothetical protein